MWCDNFDMDLYKVIPEAKRLVSPVQGVRLFTHGHLTDGKLNHPSVWSGYHGIMAFFGFDDPAKPAGYWTDDPVIECTFEEVVRDAWCHSYQVIVELRHIWSAYSLSEQFEDIMWHIRGWDRNCPRDIQAAKKKVLISLAIACGKMKTLSTLEEKGGKA